jgi:hypothetical protein
MLEQELTGLDESDEYVNQKGCDDSRILTETSANQLRIMPGRRPWGDEER